ncbi:MAG: cell division protein FtsZ [Flavobacteriales bacterium]|nr:cell division protein FtsZ [Flavobacteriales bacterium]
MKFELPSELASIIKVIGVGGGGSNAVNHMYSQSTKGVDFIICNTDRQALDLSPVPVKLQLGLALTEGLGAGSVPKRGQEAAQENLDEIRQLLSNRTKMVFITAGMGGGTGTGAAPVIARVAKDMGILTVGIVTMPFRWEGKKRIEQAKAGIEDLRQSVDTLLVINNDRLRELFGNLKVDEAFAHADNVLSTAARGIADVINNPGKVNVDFEDVRTVMSNSGSAIMGLAEAEGEDRAVRAVREALASPLLNDNDIRGAKFVLLNVALGNDDISMDEMSEITDHIQEAAGSNADVIWGYCRDNSLGDRIRVSVIATGFNLNSDGTPITEPAKERIVTPLTPEVTPITRPLENPFSASGATPVAAPAVEKEDPLAPFLKPATPEPVATVPPAAPVATPVAEPVKQGTIEFDIKPTPVMGQPVVERPAAPVQEDKVTHDLYEAAPQEEEEPVARVQQPVAMQPSTPQAAEPRITHQDHHTRVEDRLSRMREMSLRLRSPNGVSDMEREPAFRRKNITLGDVPHSAESSVSRYTLSEETDENGERRVELRRNNPFLHDNVD